MSKEDHKNSSTPSKIQEKDDRTYFSGKFYLQQDGPNMDVKEQVKQSHPPMQDRIHEQAKQSISEAQQEAKQRSDKGESQNESVSSSIKDHVCSNYSDSEVNDQQDEGSRLQQKKGHISKTKKPSQQGDKQSSSNPAKKQQSKRENCQQIVQIDQSQTQVEGLKHNAIKLNKDPQNSLPKAEQNNQQQHIEEENKGQQQGYLPETSDRQGESKEQKSSLNKGFVAKQEAEKGQQSYLSETSDKLEPITRQPNQRNNLLQSLLNEAKSNLSISRQNQAYLSAEISKLDKITSQLRDKLKAQQIKAKNLKSSNQKLTKQLRQKYEAYRSQLNTLNSESQANLENKKKKEKQIELKDEEITRLQRKIFEYQKKYQSNLAQIKQEQEKMDEKDRKHTQILQQYKEVMNQFSQQICKSKCMYSALVQENSQQKRQLEDLDSKQRSHFENIQQNKAHISSLLKQNQVLKAQIPAQMQILKESTILLKDEIFHLERSADRIQADNVQIQNQFVKFQTEIEQLSHKIKKLEEKSREETTTMMQKFEGQRKQFQKAKKQEIDQMLAKFNDMKEKIERKEMETRGLQVENKLQNQRFVRMTSILLQESQFTYLSSQQREKAIFDRFSLYIEKIRSEKDEILQSVMNDYLQCARKMTDYCQQSEKIRLSTIQKERQFYMIQMEVQLLKNEVDNLINAKQQLIQEKEELSMRLQDAYLNNHKELREAVDKTVSQLSSLYTNIIQEKESKNKELYDFFTNRQEHMQDRSKLRQQIHQLQKSSLNQQIQNLQASHRRKDKEYQQNCTTLEDTLSNLKDKLVKAEQSYNEILSEKEKVQLKLAKAEQEKNLESDMIKTLIDKIQKMTTDELQNYMISNQDSTSQIIIELTKLFFYREKSLKGMLMVEEDLQIKLQALDLQMKSLLCISQLDKDEIAKLKEKLALSEKKLDQAVKKSNQQSNQRANEANGAVVKLNLQNKKYLDQLQQKNIFCRGLQAKISEKEAKQRELSRKISQFQRENAQLARTSSKGSEIQALKRENQRLSSELLQKTSSNRSLDARLAQLQKQVAAYSQQKAKFEQQISTLQQKVRNQQAELNLKRRQTVQNNRLKEQTVSRANYLALQSRYNNLVQEKNILNGLNISLVDQKQKLSKQLEDLNQKINRAETSEKDANQVRQMKQKIEVLEQKQNSNRSQMKKLKSAYETLKSQNEGLRRKNASIVASSCTTCQYFEQENQKMQQNVTRYEQELKQKDDEIKKMREELKQVSRSSIRNVVSPPKQMAKIVEGTRPAKQQLNKGLRIFTYPACMTDEVSQYKEYLKAKILEVSEEKAFETKLIYRHVQANQNFSTMTIKEQLSKYSLVFLFKRGKSMFGVVFFEARIKNVPFAFVISLNNKKEYYRSVINNIVPARFDSLAQLTFGNGQIKYRHSSRALTFSESVRYFEKFTKNDLMGEENKISYEIEEIEIHRVTFL